MAAKGVRAKELTHRVTQPLVYEPRPDWPAKVYEEFRRQVEQIDAPTERTGEWLPATRHAPAVADLVRRPSQTHSRLHVGQVVRVKSVSVFICRFTADDLSSFELACPAAELEVFRYHLSREERIARTGRAREWLFRPNSQSNV
jgi:hypothetical protein